MSAPETARPPDLSCPHCQAPLAPEQEWCLECGNPVRQRVIPPTRRRGRVLAATAALVAVAALAVALSLIGLGQRGEQRADRRAATSPAPAADRGAAASAPSARTVPRGSPTPGTLPPPTTPATADTAPLWPTGERSYTVVVLSSPRRATAEKRARQLIAGGADAGILHADDYASFAPGSWIVWRGRYQDKAKAQEAMSLLRRRIDGVYVTFVRPR